MEDVRAITGSAGTAILGSGKELRGWALEAAENGEHFTFVFAEVGDTPGCGRELAVGAPTDDSRVAVVRVAHLAAWVYADDDGWGA